MGLWGPRSQPFHAPLSWCVRQCLEQAIFPKLQLEQINETSFTWAVTQPWEACGTAPQGCSL